MQLPTIRWHCSFAQNGVKCKSIFKSKLHTNVKRIFLVPLDFILETVCLFSIHFLPIQQNLCLRVNKVISDPDSENLPVSIPDRSINVSPRETILLTDDITVCNWTFFFLFFFIQSRHLTGTDVGPAPLSEAEWVPPRLKWFYYRRPGQMRLRIGL